MTSLPLLATVVSPPGLFLCVKTLKIRRRIFTRAESYRLACQGGFIAALGVQNNTRRDLSDTLILFERKREKAIAEIRAMAELQEQAEALIHSIQYGPWERLFFRRYILGETWEKAADETYFSQSGAMLAAGKVYKQLEASKEWERIQEKRRGA